MQLFTVEQANRTLPLVRKIVADIVSLHQRWRQTIVALDDVALAQRANEPNDRGEQLEREAQALAREIDECQRELESLGIQLKDRRQGLVDFPTLMGGRRVLLCWRLGEPEIQFWHEEDAGFPGRQPLSPSLVAS
jgi:hypothetical protein